MVVVVPMIMIMIMIVVVVVVVVMIVLMTAVMVMVMVMFVAAVFFVALVFPLIVMPFLMEVSMGGVHVTIPTIGHEVDGSPARVVFTAMFRPMSLMSSGYMQIERLRRWPGYNDSRRYCYYWTRHDELGVRQVSQIDLAIQTWCGEVYGNTYVTGFCYGRDTERSGACDGTTYD